MYEDLVIIILSTSSSKLVSILKRLKADWLVFSSACRWII